MTDMTRRTLTRGAAWTVPVIAVAAAAPAFAASQPITCAPTAECKQPGEGSFTKDYAIRTNCTSTTPITGVTVFDDKDKVDRVGVYDEPTGTWIARGFNDSRRNRSVTLTDKYGQTETYAVAFPPC